MPSSESGHFQYFQSVPARTCTWPSHQNDLSLCSSYACPATNFHHLTSLTARPVIDLLPAGTSSTGSRGSHVSDQCIFRNGINICEVPAVKMIIRVVHTSHSCAGIQRRLDTYNLQDETPMCVPIINHWGQRTNISHFGQLRSLRGTSFDQASLNGCVY